MDILKNRDIKELYEYVEHKQKYNGWHDIAVFDFDTMNTSDNKGLVMFSKCNNYWNNQR